MIISSKCESRQLSLFLSGRVRVLGGQKRYGMVVHFAAYRSALKVNKDR